MFTNLNSLFQKDYNSNLLQDGLSREVYERYVDILDTAEEGAVKELYSVFLNAIPMIEARDSSYGHLIDSHKIIIDSEVDLYKDKRGKGVGFFHESAHWIDYEMNLRVSGSYGIPYSIEFSGGMLAKTLIRELKDYVSGLNPEKSFNENKYAFFSELKNMNPAISHSISTLSDGVFQGRYTDKLPYGQSSFYWGSGKQWQDQLTKECFAEFMQAHIASDDVLRWYRKNLPDTYETFMEIVDLMLEDLYDSMSL